MPDRHVILVCLDTVRKDYFDRYAPRLQQLADVSVDQCRAASSWTVPSHASMFTGRLPHRHGVHAGAIDFESLDVSETFLQAYEDHRTVGVSANAFVDSAFGFDTLFDDFYDVTPSVVFGDGLYLRDFTSERDGAWQYLDYVRQALRDDHPLKSLVNGVSGVTSDLKPSFVPRFSDDGARTVSNVAADVVDEADRSCCLFLNYMDAHGPFAPTTRYGADLHSAPRGWTSDEIDIWKYNTGTRSPYADDVEHYRDLYAAAIDYLDRTLAELVKRIEARSDREVTFVITSDHGENLGYEPDDHLIEHKGSLTEGLLHVPFLIRNPPTEVTESRESGYFSHLALPDFLEGVASGNCSLQFQDTIPAELIGLGASDVPLDGDEFEYWNRTIRAVYDGESKHVWDSLGNRMKYEIDRSESCSRGVEESRSEEPPHCDRLFTVAIDEYGDDASGCDDDISAAGERRLQDLGYM